MLLKILFVINPGSGKNDTDWKQQIETYFANRPEEIQIFQLPDSCPPETIREQMETFKPDRMMAVGGDGTVKLIAELTINTGMPIGIIPAGSANGMAKELGIPVKTEAALETSHSSNTMKIHAIRINDELCIHLSDIGFNAFVVKKFESGNKRGMWAYVKAAWKVLWQHSKMDASMKVAGKDIRKNAAMIVIANATRYGSGATVNPDGKLDDELFEVVIVKKVSFSEIFKMMVSHQPYNREKTEVLQTRSLKINSRKKAHFQVDGEYLGKVSNIDAELLPAAITIVIPEKEN
ncbi:MAG: diacylglycerol kinase family lipid kinase [Gemmatimonadaceae bacterium]|nr:diacylglycerol kinase family lipid kinase [Chitinophagaceae bacterium]